MHPTGSVTCMIDASAAAGVKSVVTTGGDHGRAEQHRLVRHTEAAGASAVASGLACGTSIGYGASSFTMSKPLYCSF